jgi:PKD repeat protein
VRWGVVCAALLILVPAATGATTFVSIQASATSGSAPLDVAFTAVGDATAYHWTFGDGSVTDGQTVSHTFAAGRWTVTLSARSSSGETTTATTMITASGLSLSARGPARYGRKLAFRGSLVPAVGGVSVSVNGPRGRIGTVKTRSNGTYLLGARIRLPGSYQATSTAGTSPPLALQVVPKLVARLAGTGARGTPYFFRARVVPAGAGTLAVSVFRGDTVVIERTSTGSVRIRLDTSRLKAYRIRTEVRPATGYAGTVRILRANVVLPRLALGARGLPVTQLGSQLRALHYAAPASTTFDGRLLDAVYAFQKVQGLPRTGVVDARFWSTLGNPRRPPPRYSRPASHVEVNKGLQVLYVVRKSQVALILPISTAGLAGTYTPVGRFAVYRKVAGFDPSPLGTLYDPLYFTGGYAIHGNPSVPPYPASHGCVRIPMWLAPLLYRTLPYGETVYVY